MQLKLGCFVFTLLLFKFFGQIRAGSDVDGTIGKQDVVYEQDML